MNVSDEAGFLNPSATEVFINTRKPMRSSLLNQKEVLLTTQRALGWVGVPAEESLR